jgi:hypothetical protein
VSVLERRAADALDEYLTLLRSTPEFDEFRNVRNADAARVEVNRVAAAVTYLPGYLTEGAHNAWNPAPLPGGGYTYGFALSGLIWRGWWDGWTVEHGLKWPTVTHGSVWLGVANNSARVDLTRDSYAHWMARFSVAAALGEKEEE